MDEDTWTAVENYFDQALAEPDPALDMALEAGREAGLPMGYSISPSQGRFLQLLVSIRGAKDVLEIGTLGGYSTIWLARGLEDAGRILTLELRDERANTARTTFAKAGLDDVIEVRTGPASHTLRDLIKQRDKRFDFIFVDADKQTNPAYFRWALELSLPGTVIVFDNVVRQGKILDAENDSPAVRGVRELVKAIGHEPRVKAGAIQIVSSKGHDGLLVIHVKQAASEYVSGSL